MAVSGNSDNEMLLVNNTGLPESNLMLIEKLHSQKKKSLIKKKIRLIKKFFSVDDSVRARRVYSQKIIMLGYHIKIIP